MVARRDPAGTRNFECAFYLHDLEWLFARAGSLRYTLDFVRRTGGEYLSFFELRTSRDLKIVERCFAAGDPFGVVCEKLGVQLGRELHMTDDSHRFTPVPAAPDGAFDRILNLLKAQDSITSSDVQTLIGLDVASVRPYLDRLVSEGHALREGKARATRYRRK